MFAVSFIYHWRIQNNIKNKVKIFLYTMCLILYVFLSPALIVKASNDIGDDIGSYSTTDLIEQLVNGDEWNSMVLFDNYFDGIAYFKDNNCFYKELICRDDCGKILMDKFAEQIIIVIMIRN